MRRFLEIPLSIYRLTVVVTWESALEEVLLFAGEHKVEITPQWREEFERHAKDATCSGFCITFGDDNSDLLLWLRKRPTKASEYGVLYHELFHAVRAVVRSRSLGAEEESPAFLYEYLATRCNQVLWNYPES